jgi:hypothetical protein
MKQRKKQRKPQVKKLAASVGTVERVISWSNGRRGAMVLMRGVCGEVVTKHIRLHDDGKWWGRAVHSAGPEIGEVVFR